jgi:hypothetical protein
MLPPLPPTFLAHLSPLSLLLPREFPISHTLRDEFPRTRLVKWIDIKKRTVIQKFLGLKKENPGWSG